MQTPPNMAIVTGASRGIGAATALGLAREGYAVAVNYQSNKQRADKIVSEIVSAGGKAVAIQADIGNAADVIRLFDEAERALGPVSALVNNAGVNLEAGGVEHLAWDAAERMFAINVLGLMVCCREALARMKKTGGGIVNVSSEAGRFGGNRISAYAASKAAVNTFTVGFAREAAAHHIRVNAVSPGIIDTEVHAGKHEALKVSIPLGRIGRPEEVADVIVWLLSERASYVSGSIISVAGAR